ncbi:MAG: redoxin domain-containing protein, partial [Verrucomicrobia bacterium]|nr:redoxin domain-containing protein [Verrucomicrobiota bacterium]MDA1007061.1 redoxin domain-containing protein [Verrucomicrobiota bacterium]
MPRFTAVLSVLATLVTPLFAEPQAVKTLEIGSPAPDFTLPGVDGHDHSLADYREHQLLVIIFTCNHCPDAVAAQERIKSLTADYKDRKVGVVAISGNDPKALQLWELGWSVYGDSFEEMKEHAKEEEYNFPYLYDGDTQKTTLAYGAQATPHVFIFDEKRILRYQGRLDNGKRNPGPASENNAREVLDLLLAGQEIPKEKQTSRVFGCSTKWNWKRELAAQKTEEWNNLPVTVAKLDPATAKSLAANATDKIRLINVWSTTCGPCVAEFPDLVDTYLRYQSRPFELITISTDPADKASAVQAFLQKQHAALSPQTAPSLKAEGRETNNYHYRAEDLDALADALDPEWQGPLPHTLLLAPGGKVLFRHTGQIDPIELRRAIVAQLRSSE